MTKQAGEAFTDQELDGLSDQEREILEGGDDDESKSLQAIAGEGDDNADDDNGDGDDDADGEAEKAAAAAKAKQDAEAKAAADAEAKRKAELEKMNAEDRAKAEAADKAAREAAAAAAAAKKAEDERKAAEEAERKRREAAAADEDEDEPFIFTYQAQPVEKYDEQVKALDARKADALSKFKKGDMELEQYEAERDKIDGERRVLEQQKFEADLAAKQAEQAAQRQWQWECSRFMRNTAKHEGIDYRTNASAGAALDAEVRRIANDPANAGKDGPWILKTAHEKVKADLNLGGKQETAAERTAREAAEKKAKDEAALRDAKNKRQSGAGKVPPNLGGLPAAGANDLGKDGEGEFAEAEALMDKGDSMALEAYIAGKSAEWQERWARANG